MIEKGRQINIVCSLNRNMRGQPVIGAEVRCGLKLRILGTGIAKGELS